MAPSWKKGGCSTRIIVYCAHFRVVAAYPCQAFAPLLFCCDSASSGSQWWASAFIFHCIGFGDQYVIHPMLNNSALDFVQQRSVLSVEVKMYANHTDKSGEGERTGHGFLCMDTLCLVSDRAAVVAFQDSNSLGCYRGVRDTSCEKHPKERLDVGGCL